MVIFPLIDGDFSWDFMMNVWHRWQGINVGIFALFSSLIALYATLIKEDIENDRKLIVALSFLPDGLVDLTKYIKANSVFLLELFEVARDSKGRPRTLDLIEPDPPSKYRIIFANVMAAANEDMAKHLADIMKDLQVHTSRSSSIVNDYNNLNNKDIIKRDITSYLFELGLLKAMVDHLWDVSRRESDFVKFNRSSSVVHEAFQSLQIILCDTKFTELNELVEKIK